MLKSLQGKTAIVTGASRGIGRGIALRLGRAGLNVLVVSRNQSDADKVAAEIGAHASGFVADVSEDGDCDAMAAAALARYGSIDVLCANAGIFPTAKLGEMTGADFDRVISSNLKSSFLSISSVLPGMTAAGGGRIVLTSSITGPITGFPGWSHYGASKAGQLGFMRTACIELAKYGITVNAVMPGPVETTHFNRGHPPGSAKRQTVIDKVLVGRLGTTQEIARAVTFLLDKDSGFITGQSLFVCGGTSVTGTGGE